MRFRDQSSGCADVGFRDVLFGLAEVVIHDMEHSQCHAGSTAPTIYLVLMCVCVCVFLALSTENATSCMSDRMALQNSISDDTMLKLMMPPILESLVFSF